MRPHAETLEELKGDMKYFLQALDRPVLRKDVIKFAPMDGFKNKPAKRKGRKKLI